MGTAYTGLLLAAAASVQGVRMVNGQTVGSTVLSHLVTRLGAQRRAVSRACPAPALGCLSPG